ncbi:AAA family ATPase [Endozoicomonas sp. 4G]|uniref:AAA family ATPase n=1 Tax=Endozoicomonas sp. 4G TaxID=2872754 RepID=UPI00207882F4|nr:AAA family ATPase [Endozoicomonas sp. 4G]
MANEELVSISRLALSGKEADLRMYLAKQVRKLRKKDPETAGKLEELLKSHPARSNGVLRKASSFSGRQSDSEPLNEVGGVSLLKSFGISEVFDSPLLQSQVAYSLEQVLQERSSLKLLTANGLQPTSSLIFQGPPGVGKTMTAQWLAAQLKLPFYILDLTAVMSSYLGKTGSNLRSAIEFAKTHPCVLLLDEIDAIAKKRSDEADVGELKRLVTVMLQELEQWPSEGLLIAATNHPELVDPALWRRFDMEVTFTIPTKEHVKKAILRYLGQDQDSFKPWMELLVDSLKGKSYSHIKRVIFQLRRLKLIDPNRFESEAITYMKPSLGELSSKERINFAVRLVREFGLTQQKAAKVSHVSRDTIRKRIQEFKS